jgi:hypothetical protein
MAMPGLIPALTLHVNVGRQIGGTRGCAPPAKCTASSAKAAHGLGDALLIRRDHVAQILRVQAGGDRRRADQIAEHHRHLPAFGEKVNQVLAGFNPMYMTPFDGFTR